MNADEIVREARGLHADWMAYESVHHGGGRGAKSDDGEAKRAFMLWLVDDFPAMCDLIESLQAQLTASQRREKAAVELIGKVSQAVEVAFNATDYVKPNTGIWHTLGLALDWIKAWRGLQEAEKGENNA